MTGAPSRGETSALLARTESLEEQLADVRDRAARLAALRARARDLVGQIDALEVQIAGRERRDLDIRASDRHPRTTSERPNGVRRRRRRVALSVAAAIGAIAALTLCPHVVLVRGGGSSAASSSELGR